MYKKASTTSSIKNVNHDLQILKSAILLSILNVFNVISLLYEQTVLIINSQSFLISEAIANIKEINMILLMTAETHMN